MVEALKSLLTAIGLSPFWGSIILILAIGVSFFLKEYLGLRNKFAEIKATYRSTYQGKIDDKYIEYSRLQVKALLEAYRMLYESKSGSKMTGVRLAKEIEKADALIMQPFTEYASFLDDLTKGNIYNIHNILEQFKYDPSEAAIKSFWDYRSDFFQDIQKTIDELSIKRSI